MVDCSCSFEVTELLVGRLQFFVHREDFFVGGLQLLVAALELFDQQLLPLPRSADRFELLNQIRLASAVFRPVREWREQLLEDDQPEAIDGRGTKGSDRDRTVLRIFSCSMSRASRTF